MALTHSAAVRTSFASDVLTRINAGATNPAPVLQLWNAGATTLLTEVALDTPAAGTVSAEELTLSGFPKTDTDVDATGTAAICMVRDRDGNEIFRGTATVSGGGGDFQTTSTDPSSLNTVQGTEFRFDSFVYTASP